MSPGKPQDPKNLINKVTNYRHFAGEVVVPVNPMRPNVVVPKRAIDFAEKYVSSDRPRAVVQEIYEQQIAIEVGVVIKTRHSGHFRDYVHHMYEEDAFHTTKKLKEDGDGGVALT